MTNSTQLSAWADAEGWREVDHWRGEMRFRQASTGFFLRVQKQAYGRLVVIVEEQRVDEYSTRSWTTYQLDRRVCNLSEFPVVLEEMTRDLRIQEVQES